VPWRTLSLPSSSRLSASGQAWLRPCGVHRSDRVRVTRVTLGAGGPAERQRRRGRLHLQPAEAAAGLGRQADPVLAVQAARAQPRVQVRDLRQRVLLGPPRVRAPLQGAPHCGAPPPGCKQCVARARPLWHQQSGMEDRPHSISYNIILARLFIPRLSRSSLAVQRADTGARGACRSGGTRTACARWASPTTRTSSRSRRSRTRWSCGPPSRRAARPPARPLRPALPAAPAS